MTEYGYCKTIRVNSLLNKCDVFSIGDKSVNSEDVIILADDGIERTRAIHLYAVIRNNYPDGVPVIMLFHELGTDVLKLSEVKVAFSVLSTVFKKEEQSALGGLVRILGAPYHHTNAISRDANTGVEGRGVIAP